MVYNKEYMATPKQEKLIKLLIENYGTQGETKSLGKLMIEAGYSEESAKNPNLILSSETIKEGIEDFRKQLVDKRRRAITHLTDDKLEKSDARSLSSIIDTFTKNIQLLGGQPTEINRIDLSSLSNEELAKLANESES